MGRTRKRAARPRRGRVHLKEKWRRQYEDAFPTGSEDSDTEHLRNRRQSAWEQFQEVTMEPGFSDDGKLGTEVEAGGASRTGRGDRDGWSPGEGGSNQEGSRSNGGACGNSLAGQAPVDGLAGAVSTILGNLLINDRGGGARRTSPEGSIDASEGEAECEGEEQDGICYCSGESSDTDDNQVARSRPVTPRALFEERFLAAFSNHNVTKRAAKAFASIFQDTDMLLAALKDFKNKVPSFKSMLNRERKTRPKILMTCRWLNLETGRFEKASNIEVYPRGLYGDKDKFMEEYVLTYMPLKELIAYHNEKHHRPADSYLLGLDDVPEAKSNLVSETVVCLTFPPCREVYPWQILRSTKSNPLTVDELLDPIVRDLNASGLRLVAVVADKVMRAKIGCHMAATGYFCCEKCELRGRQNTAVGRKKPVYVGLRAALRTDRGVRQMAENLESVKLDDDRLGVTGYSPLLRLQGYNAVLSMPQDFMHSWCLGVLRRTWRLCFVNAATFQGKLNLQHVGDRICGLLSRHSVPREFSRRTTKLEAAVLKASQWLNVAVHLFPLILEELEFVRNAGRARDVWALLSFLLRAYLLNDEEYGRVRAKYDLEELHEILEEAYIETFSDWNMTYNMHSIGHSPMSRKEHPFTLVSAFKFESSYGELIRKWCPGTQSIGKQGMDGAMLRKSQGHVCEKTVTFSHKRTAAANDTIVFDRSWKVYKVLSVEGNLKHAVLNVRRMVVEKYTHTLSCGTKLKFHDVASYVTEQELEGSVKKLKYRQVRGKGVPVGGVVSLVSKEVISEFS